MLILGVLNVKMINSMAITDKMDIARPGLIFDATEFLKRWVSYAYAAAAAIKKIAIFNQSGDLPIAPL